jgi:hypothetical protein
MQALELEQVEQGNQTEELQQRWDGSFSGHVNWSFYLNVASSHQIQEAIRRMEWYLRKVGPIGFALPFFEVTLCQILREDGIIRENQNPFGKRKVLTDDEEEAVRASASATPADSVPLLEEKPEEKPKRQRRISETIQNWLDEGSIVEAEEAARLTGLSKSCMYNRKDDYETVRKGKYVWFVKAGLINA